MILTTPFMKYRLYIVVLALLIMSAGCSNNGKTPTVKSAETKTTTTAPPERKAIVFFGNSLTAGYGLSSPTQAFPALIQNKIDSTGLAYTVVNAGVSGETSSGGLSRIDWILRQPLDVFVLELGANDGLRGIPISETKKNLQAIIDKVKAKYPNAKVVLAGMQLPPNMGQTYATQFRNIYPELAKENGVTLIPFLLEGVGGEVKLNQQDGIHPTAEGAQLVAQNVWRVLQPVL
jgi:acyl-CoA thioesterase I